MPRHVRSKPTPWIESLIQSYGAEDGSSKYLEAHVTAVGEMTQSQAVSCKGHTGLLFLSDEVVQVPAILTAAAWELLQEQEEKECFSSLVGTTVFIRDYRLQFHMAAEQTKSRFFLSVGELATKSVNPVRVMTPCCTTLPSVQLKIIKTWESLLGQEDSQKGQSHLDLSDLLGEWQLDCLEAVLQDVRERLAKARDAAHQPSTSNTVSHSDAAPTTSWDVDRVQYKGCGKFSIPTRYLLIPEEDAQLGQRLNVRSRHASCTLCAASPKTPPPSVDVADQRITEAAESKPGTSNGNASPVQGTMLLENAVIGLMAKATRPLSNPWDMFLPPCDTSSSSFEGAEDGIPAPTTLKSPPQHPVTSTQLLASSPKDPHSCFPPYQKPASSAKISATPSGSLARSLRADQSFHPNQNLPSLVPERRFLEKDASAQEEAADRKCGKAKRKRSEPVAEELNVSFGEVTEEVQMSRSPPSWLFESRGGLGADEGSVLRHHQSLRKQPRKTPTTHSSGAPFTYSYQVSGQNLQDFSHFKVSESVVQWAVKYLLTPEETSEVTLNASPP